MSIGGQRVTKPQFAHEPKAKAIGERPILIVSLQEISLRLGKPFGLHPLDSASRGGKDRFEQRGREVSVPGTLAKLFARPTEFTEIAPDLSSLRAALSVGRP